MTTSNETELNVHTRMAAMAVRLETMKAELDLAEKNDPKTNPEHTQKLVLARIRLDANFRMYDQQRGQLNLLNKRAQEVADDCQRLLAEYEERRAARNGREV